jgi:chemotaxis signal transduction protein
MVGAGLTLDELLADLNRELVGTWGDAAGAAAPGAVPATASPTATAAGGRPGAVAERCLLTTLGGQRFALPARAVVAASDRLPIAAVPFSPPWLRGLARAANGVVAVIDLARRLSPSPPAAPGAPIEAEHDEPGGAGETLIVVRTQDGELDAGFSLPGIARLVALPGLPGRPPAPGELEARLATLVTGLVADPTHPEGPPIAVLDVDRLLADLRTELTGRPHLAGPVFPGGLRP